MQAAYANNLTGDAQAMAFRAGAELANLEFIFGPRFAGISKGKLIIISLMPFQTQGAYILNSQGTRFMEQYSPQLGEQRSGMGLLALAASKEITEVLSGVTLSICNVFGYRAGQRAGHSWQKS
ncbi:MAG: FAD-binding protein [Thermodesulfobacteriota bacterium]